MDANYSFLDEVWKEKHDDSTNSSNKMDDIIKYYVDDDKNPTINNTVQEKTDMLYNDNVEGYTPLAQHHTFFDFNNFFDLDMQNFENANTDDIKNIPEDEKIFETIKSDELNSKEPDNIKAIKTSSVSNLEAFDNTSPHHPPPYFPHTTAVGVKNYSELLLFIMVGIFLIILFDRLVALGKCLR